MSEQKTLVYPGAIGFGVETAAGRGGQVVVVDRLTDTGSGGVPGELRYALRSVTGPRTVIFAVGGVIQLNRPLTISRGSVSIFGDTAPWPGIIIRGTLRSIRATDVFISGITIWCDPVASDREQCVDVIGPGERIVIDHCSLLYGAQTCVQFICGEWRNPPNPLVWIRDCTVSNCIIAYPVLRPGNDGHRGLIVQEWCERVAVLDTLFVECDWRGPCWQNDLVQIVVAGNLNYGPGEHSIHAYPTHNLGPAYAVVAGNEIRSTAYTTTGGQIEIGAAPSGSQYYIADNNAPSEPRVDGSVTLVGAPPSLPDGSLWPTNYVARPAGEAYKHVTANAGARPWDREPSAAQTVLDVRIRVTHGFADAHTIWPAYPAIYRPLELPDDPQEIMADGYSRLEHWVWEQFGPYQAPAGPDLDAARTQLGAIRAGLDEIANAEAEHQAEQSLRIAQLASQTDATLSGLG